MINTSSCQPAAAAPPPPHTWRVHQRDLLEQPVVALRALELGQEARPKLPQGEGGRGSCSEGKNTVGRTAEACMLMHAHC